MLTNRRIKRLIKKSCYKRSREQIALSRTPWEKDFLLVELGPIGLFKEYLEMSECSLLKLPASFNAICACFNRKVSKY